MNKQGQKTEQTLTLGQIKSKMRLFVEERDWNQFHTPRNLVLALTGQVGEVAQIFQWRGQVKQGLPQFTDKQKQHVGDELADVLSYLIRLADVCHIDLGQAFLHKLSKNCIKYPKDLAKGSMKKYTEYEAILKKDQK